MKRKSEYAELWTVRFRKGHVRPPLAVVFGAVLALTATMPSSGRAGAAIQGGWTRTTVSGPAGAPTSQLTALGCWSQRGCILGGVHGDQAASWVATTANAGESWVYISQLPAPLAGGVESISCDRRGCFMVGENLAENADALGFSRNHGRTWSLVPLPRPWVAESITPSFIGCTATTCVVYGSNVLALPIEKGLSGYRVGIAATKNDGRTWSRASYPAGSQQLDSIACVASGKCWALYRPDEPVEGVAVSTDGARTWTPVGTIGESFDPDHFAGFGCADSTTCYLVDDSNTVFVTSDGGRTWESAEPVQNPLGSTDLETDALSCGPMDGPCYIAGIGPPASLWVTN
jgi:hypothetical protein